MKKISEILREEREKKGYSFQEIEKATKIKTKFLLSIEEGKYRDLPSESYALGFVKNYAQFLGVSQDKAAALFRREFHEEKREVLPEYQKETDRFKKNYLNPKIVLVTVLVTIFLGYISFQYHSFLFGPPLSISTPQDNQVVKDNVVQITGKTDPYAVVFVDGEEVFINIDGTFKKSVYVFPGEKKIKIIAKSRFGRETVLERSVKVQ